MSQTDVDPAHGPEPDPDGTSDRLYTTTELEAFAERWNGGGNPRAGLGV